MADQESSDVLRAAADAHGVIALDTPEKIAALTRLAADAIAHQVVREQSLGAPEPLDLGIHVADIGGYCPVQASGAVDGRPFYFRARHNAWSLQIADHIFDDPVTVGWTESVGGVSGFVYSEPYGGSDEDAASWMPRTDVHQAINRAVAIYREWRGVTALQERIGAWGAKTFPASTPLSTALHLREEAVELVNAIDDGDTANARDECADIIILAMQFASTAGFNLYDAVEEKFARVKRRHWQAPDADGIVRHVADDAE